MQTARIHPGRSRRFDPVAFTLALLGLAAAPAGGHAGTAEGPWGRLSLSFEENRGQAAGGGDEFLTNFPAVLPNRAPAAANDLASTRAGVPVEIDVLANDLDPNGDALAVIEASAANGTVAVNPRGTLTYTPADGFTGTDSLSYTVTDGLGGIDAAVAWVTVSLTPACEAPPSYFNVPQSGLVSAILGALAVDAAADSGGFPVPFEVTDCDADGLMEILIPETPPGYLKAAGINLTAACAPTPPTQVEVFFVQPGADPVTWTALDTTSTPVATATTSPSLFLQSVVFSHPAGIARVEMTGSAICLDEVCYVCANPGGCSVVIVDTDVTLEPAEIVVDLSGTAGKISVKATSHQGGVSVDHIVIKLTAKANKPKRYLIQTEAPAGSDPCNDDANGSAGGRGGGSARWTLFVTVECADGSESTDSVDVAFPCP